jgi:FkbM family methyltransferase
MELKKLKKLRSKNKSISMGFYKEKLFYMDLKPIGYDIKLYYYFWATHATFIAKQYNYTIDQDNIIKADKGDTVIDAGGCYGDTALYFSECVSDAGKVYTFEFIPSNLSILKENIKLNPTLEKRINVVESPIFSESDLYIDYTDSGSGSKININNNLKIGDIQTISIDDFVERNNINIINFIKMDIEGTELSALKGAQKTLNKFKPKLAIAIYHSVEDIIAIPQFLHNLNLGYKFYLGHYTIHTYETILFATIQYKI